MIRTVGLSGNTGGATNWRAASDASSCAVAVWDHVRGFPRSALVYTRDCANAGAASNKQATVSRPTMGLTWSMAPGPQPVNPTYGRW